MLLIAIVFVMGIVQTFFAPERTRALLSGKRVGVWQCARRLARLSSRPFCSCSAVPLFIRIPVGGACPLGVTFSFLISAPMVNEVALVLLFGMFGWKVAALYLGMGLTYSHCRPASSSAKLRNGTFPGRLGAEDPGRASRWRPQIRPIGWIERCEAGWAHVKQIVGKVWPYILLGIGVGGRPSTATCPRSLWPRSMGKDVWWAGSRRRRLSACRCTATPPASFRSFRR